MSCFIYSNGIQGQNIDFSDPNLKGLIIKQLNTDSLMLFEAPGIYGYKSYLEGDFFGDGVNDLVLLARDSAKTVRLIIINYSLTDTLTSYVYHEITDYSFVGAFKKILQNEVLWSNWVEDRRELKDVPKTEQIRLKYDAIYVHAGESCGGGFIFWKNNKWNWLQQE